MTPFPELGKGKHPVRDAGYWYRVAYERHRLSSVIEASAAAQTWADWATAEVDGGRIDGIDQAAEAHRAVVEQFSRELARRTDPEEIRRHAARMQGVAAEAGYWLGRAGRVREAVAVVESARAVLLTTRVQRLPEDLRGRLVRAGRAELFDRYQEAEQALDTAEHRGYDPAARLSPPAGTGIERVFPPERLAWSRFQAVRQDVGKVLGITTADEDGPEWNAADGRLVYLAAARRGGYAVILEAVEPRLVALPELTATRLDDAVDRFRNLMEKDIENGEAWSALLRWLGTAAMDAVVAGLSGDDLVIVPVGGLGVLPLHAAILSGTPLRHALDVADIRYAPNARLAIEAIRHAGPELPGSALVVGVNRPPGIEDWQALRHAEQEADVISTTLAGRSRRPQPATLAAVLAALDSTDVWHFACHGFADPTDPLDSAIYLADEPLRLRHLLSRPAGRQRLALLSACQTNVPDSRRLDEVIGFPGALMRAGVSGVIASLWTVGDTSTVVLMQRFYEIWLTGVNPHTALCRAQRWLRTATLAEIQPLLPGARATTRTGPPQGRWATQPYAESPWKWAAFTYTGA